jgi:hypothetical protein
VSARAGDRAVAIAAFLAILATGFFGEEPREARRPVAAAHAVDAKAVRP